jgi:hypothetical protein
MRALLLMMLAAVAVGCGGGGGKAPPTATATATSEESQVRAKYAEYLDILDEQERLVKERNRDRERPEREALMRLGDLRKAGAPQPEIDAALAKVHEIREEKTKYLVEHGERRPHPPHPLDGKIAEAHGKASAIRREYENRWKSLGINVE